jgi:hypothetical protein
MESGSMFSDAQLVNVAESKFYVVGGDFIITGGSFQTTHGDQFHQDDYLSFHFSNEDLYNFEEESFEPVPQAFIPQGAVPITSNNINSNNITGNQIENIQNQLLNFHLHYSESTYGTLLQPIHDNTVIVNE